MVGLQKPMPLIKSLLRFALCLIILFFVFRWIDFSIWQSLTLTVLVGVAYWAYEIATSKRPPLTPYRVIILPKFDRLLLDYKLLKNVEEYDQLSALWQKKDQKLIAFTVLQNQANGYPLVYSDAHHYFQSDERFDEPIEALVFKAVRDKERDDLYLRDPTLPADDRLISPSVFLKYGKIGLDVRADWWKKVCAENPATELINTTVDYDRITGSAGLTIATIPPIAFSIFRTGQMSSSELWEAIDKALALEGWERLKPDPDAEVRDPWIRVEHKYFHVQYREI
jgi:hypothetical protein